jgi:hypothetical protein
MPWFAGEEGGAIAMMAGRAKVGCLGSDRINCLVWYLLVVG